MVLQPETGRKIESFLSSLVQQYKARFVLLVHRSGSVISVSGMTENVDLAVLSVLASASYSSTCSISEFFDEKTFLGIAHTAKNHSLQMIPIGNSAIMVLVFDRPEVPAGLQKVPLPWVERFSKIVDSMQAQTVSSLQKGVNS